MKHVGENIKRIRKAKKMTISDLAGKQISRGMISLIENGKTQPSIERLQYLAEKLNSTVMDLLGNYTRSELQQLIAEAVSYLKKHKKEEIIALLSPLLPQLDSGPEAAKLYELFAEASGLSEICAWNKAIELYEKNGMAEQALSVRLTMVSLQLRMGLKTEAKLALENCSETENAALKIRGLRLKAILQEACGNKINALALMEDAIKLAQKRMELGEYYHLLKMKAYLHYEVGDHESARSVVNTANTFVQTVQNEYLLAEHGIFFIHLEEFFEDNEEIAVELADEYVKYILLESPLNPDEKKRYIEQAYDMKARALVKMDEFSEAWELFQQIPKEEMETMYDFPWEYSMKGLSDCYLAICLEKVGKREEAVDLAKLTLDKLDDRQHSSYYRYAKEVNENFWISSTKR